MPVEDFPHRGLPPDREHTCDAVAGSHERGWWRLFGPPAPTRWRRSSAWPRSLRRNHERSSRTRTHLGQARTISESPWRTEILRFVADRDACVPATRIPSVRGKPTAAQCISLPRCRGRGRRPEASGVEFHAGRPAGRGRRPPAPTARQDVAAAKRSTSRCQATPARRDGQAG